jgi:hypothetical protein
MQTGDHELLQWSEAYGKRVITRSRTPAYWWSPAILEQVLKKNRIKEYSNSMTLERTGDTMSNSRNQPTTYPSGFYAPSNGSSLPPPLVPAMYNYSNSASQPQPMYSYPATTPPYPERAGFSNSQPTNQLHSNPRSQNNNRAHESQTPSQEWKCKACNLALDSKKALDNHTASHTKCTACGFTAAPKVVKAHYESVHGRFSSAGFKSISVAVPGCQVQRFRICVGNRPEDIQAWIAERKRRFPRTSSRSNRSQASENTAASTSTSSKKKEENGLSTLLDGYGSSSSSSAGEAKEDDKKVVGNAIQDDVYQIEEGRNKQQHASGEEKSELQINSASASNPTAKPDARYRTRPCKFFMRNGTCRNGDNCNFSHEKPTQAPKEERSTKRRKTNSNPTFLEKLLRNDVRREHTLALQLLDYIVETDFLSQREESRDVGNSGSL